MDHSVLGGDFNGFRFKFLEPPEYDAAIKLLEEELYPCMVPIGYNENHPEDWSIMFRKMMENGLNYIAVHIESGELAACRMIDVAVKDKVHEDITFLYKGNENTFHVCEEILEDEILYEKYGVSQYPVMFGLCVKTKFRKLGLANEAYRRGLDFLKRKGFEIVKCGFISPYSRRAGVKHGYEELTRRYFHDCKDKDGNILNPNSDPTDFICFGIFDLRKRN